MDGGRRPSSPAPAPASPLEVDDLLSEFLLRLPPAPSSLLRASLVCKRWLRLVSDQGFRCRFRARHHHHPPLLGFFSPQEHNISFMPIMEPPDCLPIDCFSFLLDSDFGEYQILCCRHALVLLLYLEHSIQAHEFLPQSSHDGSLVEIVGIAEDSNVFYLNTETGVFMVHLESKCFQCWSTKKDFGDNDEEDGDEPLH